MFAGVLIWRTVAAQRDSTCLARSQMHPIGPNLHAFFAFAPVRLLYRVNRDRIQMSTTLDIHRSISVTMLGSLMNCAGLPGSCEFRQLPFRLRLLRRHSALPIQTGRRQPQKFPEDWFRVEPDAVCFRATLVLPRHRYQS